MIENNVSKMPITTFGAFVNKVGAYDRFEDLLSDVEANLHTIQTPGSFNQIKGTYIEEAYRRLAKELREYQILIIKDFAEIWDLHPEWRWEIADTLWNMYMHSKSNYIKNVDIDTITKGQYHDLFTLAKCERLED